MTIATIPALTPNLPSEHVLFLFTERVVIEASASDVRADLQSAFERAIEIAARNPCRLQEHVDARRAVEALDNLAKTMTGRPLRYPSAR